MPDSDLPAPAASGPMSGPVPPDDATSVADDDDVAGAAPGTAVVLHAGGRDAGARLDRFVADRIGEALPGISRSRIQKWIALGAVRVDGQLRLPKHRIRGIERVEIVPQPLESEHAWRAEAIALPVLHADDDVIVVDKPAGLVTHPAPGHWSGTLLNALLHHFPETAGLPRAGIVHRLDRGTSGVMVCARSERAFAALTAQLADRSMHRVYVAVAGGALAASGHFDAPIGRDPHQRIRMAVVHGPNGRPARTDFRALAHADGLGGGDTAVLCKLHSGRTHQIRVHLSDAGHALAGDVLYGGRVHAGLDRPALHSWHLAFAHPDGSGISAHDAPVPDDLWQFTRRRGLSFAPAPLPSLPWPAPVAERTRATARIG